MGLDHFIAFAGISVVVCGALPLNLFFSSPPLQKRMKKDGEGGGGVEEAIEGD